MCKLALQYVGRRFAHVIGQSYAIPVPKTSFHARLAASCNLCRVHMKSLSISCSCCLSSANLALSSYFYCFTPPAGLQQLAKLSLRSSAHVHTPIQSPLQGSMMHQPPHHLPRLHPSSSSSSSETAEMDPRVWRRLPQPLVDRVLACLPTPSFLRLRAACEGIRR